MHPQDSGAGGNEILDEGRIGSFADVVSQRILVGKWKPPQKVHTLWDDAIAALDIENPTSKSLKSFVSKGESDKVLSAVREKLEAFKKSKLKFKKKDGTEVVISEMLANIAQYVTRFREIIDEVVQFDPGMVVIHRLHVHDSLRLGKNTQPCHGHWSGFFF